MPSYNIITALMTDQPATAIDIIKSTIEARTEDAIRDFVATFEYASTPKPESANVEA